ncbi:MAG: hypothetical protein JSS98_18360 [Bacteroidetes bacterium]|nr:hypothetical protein [Bacteroidota bacterium]
MTNSEGAGFTDNVLNFGKRIKGAIFGRDNYPPAEREIIQQFGNLRIIGITIYREPLENTVNGLVNAITLGKFSSIKNKYSIDELYHLYMIVTLENNKTILVEKNEVINLHQNPTVKPSAQKFALNIPPNFICTFKQLLDAGEAYMGKDWFTYNAISNNCQRFIMSILNAQPALIKANPTVNRFVVQDISGLERDLSPTSKALFNGITGLASRLNVLAKGAGFGAPQQPQQPRQQQQQQQRPPIPRAQFHINHVREIMNPQQFNNFIDMYGHRQFYFADEVHDFIRNNNN